MKSQTIELFRSKLREIERAVWLQDKSEALCCGVTLAQCHVILEIGTAGELNLRDLTAQLGLDKSTLSRTVESIVKEGLVQRVPSPRDRRVTVLRLKKKGREALNRINSTWNGICREMFRSIPSEKHSQFIESVSILAQLLNTCCRVGCTSNLTGNKGRTHV